MDTQLMKKQEAVEKKARAILKLLYLKPAESKIDPMQELENALSIHRYIVQNSIYDKGIMDEKTSYSPDSAYIEELYNGLVKRQGVCTTDAMVFKYLLSQIGMKAYVAILKNKGETKGMHAATLVEIGGQKYYFDTTQDKLEFNETDKHPDMINGAAMGSEEYGEYYDTIGILPESLRGDMLPVPDNIASQSIPKFEVYMMANWIGDLTFDEDRINETLKEINSQVLIEKKDEAHNIILRLINKIIEKFQRKERDEK